MILRQIRKQTVFIPEHTHGDRRNFSLRTFKKTFRERPQLQEGILGILGILGYFHCEQFLSAD